MNIWLDDNREAPLGWVHLHNIEEVERLVESVQEVKDFYIEAMSFDFNLSHPKNGLDVMKYLAGRCIKDKTRRFWPKTVYFHSNDLKGVELMQVFTTGFKKDLESIV